MLITGDKQWNKLLFFCVGLSIGVGFCMSWMESDFRVNGEKFTMIGLQLFYSRQRLAQILSGVDDHVRSILDYHLHFDFALMTGIFPGATCLCMIARNKIVSGSWKKFFFTLANCQLLGWAGDITENLYLLKWLERPVTGNEFILYRFIVTSKWIIGLLAPAFAIPVILLRQKKKD